MTRLPSHTRSCRWALLGSGEPRHEREGFLERSMSKPVLVVDLDDLWSEEAER